jgi:hypothetical protein
MVIIEVTYLKKYCVWDRLTLGKPQPCAGCLSLSGHVHRPPLFWDILQLKYISVHNIYYLKVYLMTNRTISLEVAELNPYYAHRGLAFISQRAMRRLGLAPGDFIKITGKKQTVAKVWPMGDDYEDDNVIGIDGVMRFNAQTSIQDSGYRLEGDPKPASKIVLRRSNL